MQKLQTIKLTKMKKLITNQKIKIAICIFFMVQIVYPNTSFANSEPNLFSDSIEVMMTFGPQKSFNNDELNRTMLVMLKENRANFELFIYDKNASQQAINLKSLAITSVHVRQALTEQPPLYKTTLAYIVTFYFNKAPYIKIANYNNLILYWLWKPSVIIGFKKFFTQAKTISSSRSCTPSGSCIDIYNQPNILQSLNTKYRASAINTPYALLVPINKSNAQNNYFSNINFELK